MPWRHRRKFLPSSRTMLVVALAALVGGVISCLVGSLLDSRVLPLARKYEQYKELSGKYTPEQIETGLNKLSGK